MTPSEMPGSPDTSTKKNAVPHARPALSPDHAPEIPRRPPSERWGHRLTDRLLVLVIIAVALYYFFSRV